MIEKRTVFIANKGFHNYTDAMRYGELKAVTIGNEDISATDRLEEKVQHALRRAEPEDFLLLGGAPIINSLAQAYLMKRFGGVNLIFHDPGKGTYTVRRGITGEPREIPITAGVIRCFNCNRPIAEAPPGIAAISTEMCELCKAEAEESMEESGRATG